MKNTSFTVPYPIGTYLVKNENGKEHLDQVNRYIVDEKGISVILVLDVEEEPRLSTEIGIDNLLKNWKEAAGIHLFGDIGTRFCTNMQFENEPIIESGLIKKLQIDHKN